MSNVNRYRYDNFYKMLSLSYGKKQNDKFYYYEKSAHKEAGFGINEYVNDLYGYEDLNVVKHWRRLLSDRNPYDFTYNNKRYHTVEHCVQACRLLSSNDVNLKSIGHKLSLDSEDPDVNKNVERCNSLCSKISLSSNDESQWKLDHIIVYEDILMTKFQHNVNLKDILLKTKLSELWCRPPDFQRNNLNEYRNFTLEYVRDKLCKQ